ncbi:MAG: response regulator [Desulfobulbaceae bacterium]|nr:response regulator [Desulfobulbaceae bacterium]HIJ89940.1 response regulator [Deltaproteobacteria bacterium]
MTKIVIIEDNPANMKLIVFLLNGAGYEVLPAVDAEIGLMLIREHLPTLVLMDVQLPGMDGLTATRLIKADPTIAHIPVVALTSHAMKGDEETMRDAGCDNYLPKPFHHQDFLAMVRKMLGES